MMIWCLKLSLPQAVEMSWVSSSSCRWICPPQPGLAGQEILFLKRMLMILNLIMRMMSMQMMQHLMLRKAGRTHSYKWKMTFSSKITLKISSFKRMLKSMSILITLMVLTWLIICKMRSKSLCCSRHLFKLMLHQQKNMLTVSAKQI